MLGDVALQQGIRRIKPECHEQRKIGADED
jgi:hypothetical protein